MANKKWRIELITDHDDPEKDKIVKEFLCNGARHLLTSAMLIADRRPPQIMVEGEDIFEGTEQISLLEDVLTEVTPEGNDTVEAA